MQVPGNNDTRRMSLVLIFVFTVLVAGCIHSPPVETDEPDLPETSPTDITDVLITDRDIPGSNYTIQYADPVPEPQWSTLQQYDAERGFLYDLMRGDGGLNIVNIVVRIPPEQIGDVTIEDISAGRMDRPIDVDTSGFDDDVTNIRAYEAEGMIGERGYAITYTKKDIFVLIAMDGHGVTPTDVLNLAQSTASRIE